MKKNYIGLFFPSCLQPYPIKFYSDAIAAAQCYIVGCTCVLSINDASRVLASLDSWPSLSFLLFLLQLPLHLILISPIPRLVTSKDSSCPWRSYQGAGFKVGKCILTNNAKLLQSRPLDDHNNGTTSSYVYTGRRLKISPSRFTTASQLVLYRTRRTATSRKVGGLYWRGK